MGILPSHERWADVPDAPALRRRRRAAHAARDLRQPRRARAAPAAAGLRALRLDADVLLRERDDRQPGRARAARCAGCRSRRSTTTDRRSRSARSRAGNGRCSTSTPARGRSANVETADLVARFVGDGHQTLAFTRSRKGSEIVAAQARRMLDERRRRRTAATAGATAPRVAAYRAGYLPAERRELEHALDDGELAGRRRHERARARHRRRRARRGRGQRLPRHARVAAPADRAGPAGPSRRAAAVLVVGDDQLDQWYAAPSAGAARRATPEAAVVNPPNPSVLRPAGRRARPTSCRSRPPTPSTSATASTTRCATSCSTTCSSRATAACTGPTASRRRRGSGCARARASSTSSSTTTRTSIGIVDGAPHLQRRAPGRAVPAPGPPVPGRGARHRRTTARWLVAADDADEHTQTRESTDITIVSRGRVGAGRRGLRATWARSRSRTRSSRTSASGRRPTS